MLSAVVCILRENLPQNRLETAPMSAPPLFSLGRKQKGLNKDSGD
jgi:hypothetical protein